MGGGQNFGGGQMMGRRPKLESNFNSSGSYTFEFGLAYSPRIAVGFSIGND